MLEAYHDATSHAVKSLEEDEDDAAAVAAGGVVVGSAASSGWVWAACCPIDLGSGTEPNAGAAAEEGERLTAGWSAGDWEERRAAGLWEGLLLMKWKMEWPAKVGG
jgi:hypothetical protein